MKRLVMVAMVLCSAAAQAMPTKDELSKAQSLVVELMAPAMAKFKAASAKDKAAAALKVADTSVEFASAAETEAAKFLLLKGAVSFYTRGEAYDKAADAVTALQSGVKNVTPEVIAEITGKATGRISEAKAPRLFALYRSAKLQARAAGEAKTLAQKLKRVKSDALQRRYAEALAVSGNWKAAYGEFAKLGSDKLKAIVEAEASGKAKNAESGEFWWAYEPVMEDADDIFKAHVAAFYRKALAAGEITGLKKNIVEQRIKPYGDAEVAAGGQGTGAGSRAPAATGLYCVIDLSGGPDAKKYPVSYLNDMPKGGWSDEYKTTKLVLRRIEPGSPVLHGEGAQQRRVSIDAAYYMGVFEVTQGQWEKIMGTRPSFLRGKKYALRPVEQVSYDMIRGRERGSEWPESNQVDADSFIGCLRARTGLEFDLPTNGQWEYACCAGVGTDYNNGGKCTDYKRNPAMDEVGRYFYNGGWNEEKWGKYEFSQIFKTLDRECGPENGTAVVGSYAPNKWGLYDMHGNVFEWCLDRKGEPKDNIIRHVVRSGWWIDTAGECHTFVCHKHDRSNHAALWHGLRLCLPLAGGAATQTSAVTAPSTGSIGLKAGGDSPVYPPNDFGGRQISEKCKIVQYSDILKYSEGQSKLLSSERVDPNGDYLAFEVNGGNKAPWVEVELPDNVLVTGLLVVNRVGFKGSIKRLRQREVPLCVWISENGTDWKSVFRNDQNQFEYRVDLQKNPARARRLRVGREPGVNGQPFHLSRIMIYAK